MIENNTIEKNRKEVNDLIVNELGITLDEFQRLSLEEQRILLLKYKTKKLEEKELSNNNINIVQELKEETDIIIKNNNDISLDEFKSLSIDELIYLSRNTKNKRKLKSKLK